ncbi:sugar ABC transporter substrate-binding protein [Natrialba asiatica]|uniref:Periplasmic binding protein/LacI transcriptional regulator n=1 Tax=Natrialba asiatica (strain ATCC 700177 / DSM 12278 / JCM 9576 / FERM P-10747 / NBRC 102637 / 172P1) TaxID=29540 RepID=M0B8N6_NATA1|nr:sugar ABC transporter substrate-binding protein [Natrialba asiatica]ELZ05989.1 periplasmic binding protein/LacI transcriptional regulator [Natrialba asiatica DSM 12278]
MPITSRRQYLVTASTIGALGVSGCTSNQGDGSLRIGVSQHLVGGDWVTAFYEAGELYAEQEGVEYDVVSHDQNSAEQVTDIHQFVAEGYDAIIAAPFDEAVDDAIDEADAEGIPVFTVNDPGTTDSIKTFTAFGNAEAGERCAELLIENLEEQYPERDTYSVLHVRGDFNQQSNARTDGFNEFIDGRDGVDVVDTIQTDWSVDDSQSTTESYLSANDPPDGIYATNMTCGIGVQNALERLDLAHPAGHDEHIVHTQPDAGPDVNPMIADGYIDATVDQPVHFYIPLAIKQLLEYLDEGEEALPQSGSTLEADDYPFEPVEHNGVELWADPIWEPADVIERDGHTHVLTAGTVVTEENVDHPGLWGNIWG